MMNNIERYMYLVPIIEYNYMKPNDKYTVVARPNIYTKLGYI